MPEPLREDVEESWLEFLNRFDAEIYPHIFRRYGFTRAEALMSWQLAKIESELDELKALIEAERE
jgi:hypothetical protein